MRPSRALPWVFQDAPPSADGIKSGSKAAAIIAKCFALAGTLHRERLAEPHLSPALARRVRDDREWPSVFSSIPRFVPGIDAIKAKIRTTSFDVQGGYHHPNLKLPLGGMSGPGLNRHAQYRPK